MESSLLAIGIIGNIISVLVFASPIKTFCRIAKNGSTEDFESTPYVVTFLSSSLWVYYGITKPDGLLVATVNGVGVVMEAVYVSLFLFYAATPEIRAKAAISAAVLDVGFPSLVVGLTRCALTEELRLVVVGGICVGLNILMYGSPLASMNKVITTKSVEFMPFFLSFFLFLNGGIWALYALLDRDIFLGIPNGMGFIFGTIQLILYMIYMKSKEQKGLETDVENTGQHRPLIESAEEDNLTNSQYS